MNRTLSEIIWACTQRLETGQVQCLEGIQVQETRRKGRERRTLNEVMRKDMMDSRLTKE